MASKRSSGLGAEQARASEFHAAQQSYLHVFLIRITGCDNHFYVELYLDRLYAKVIEQRSHLPRYDMAEIPSTS